MTGSNSYLAKIQFLGAILLLCSSSAFSQGIVGAWERGEMQAFNMIGDKCATVSTMARTWTIKKAPDDVLIGTYMADEQRLWAFKIAPECRMPGAGMSADAYRRVRIWGVTLTALGGNSWNAYAKFGECSGDGCAAGDTIQEFRTKLTLEGGVITESDRLPDGAIPTYKRSAELRHREDAAALAFQELMRPLDSGQCNRFVADSLVPESPVRNQQSLFCENNIRLMSTFPKVVRTNPLVRVAVDRVLMPDGFHSVEDVFIFGFVVFQTGTTSIRTAHLRPVDGKWRIVNHFGL